MKQSNIFRFLIFTLVVTIFINFGVESQPVLSLETTLAMSEQESDVPDIFLPVVMNNYLPPIIPETTNVLTEDTIEHLSSISGDGSIFTFDEITPELGAVEAGEIIVSEASQIAPSGFLRKVSSVTSTNGLIIIATQPATLEETIQQGALHISRHLTPSDIETSMSRDGVTLQTRAITGIDDSFFIEINDVVLYDGDGNPATTSDQIKVNGSIEIASDFDFSLEIRDWKLEELTMIHSTTETAQLEFVTEIEVSLIEKEAELARYYLTPIPVLVGIVPVVFQPVLTVSVGIDGDVHVGVTTSVTQEVTLAAGLKYEDNAWNPVNDFSNIFSLNPPTLSTSLDMKGYAGTQVALLLYGITGPYVEVNAFLKLEADIFATPWWELYGGLEVPAGVKMEIFSHTIADYETIIISYQIPLAQANQANTVAGTWTGFLAQSGKKFSFELSITQDGSEIQGTSTIRNFNGHYGVMSLSGSIDGSAVHLDEIEIIDSSETPGFYWCIKSMVLTFWMSDETSLLNGTWQDPGCNSGTIQLQRSTDPFIPIDGYWGGTLSQPGTTFPFELSLSQSSGSISGTSTIQSGSSYATMELIGFIVGDFVLLQETSIIDSNNSTNWCIKTIELTTSSNGGTQLDGEWNDPGCNSGTVTLQKQ